MITSIRLQQFRSYQDDSFEFEPGVNIIVGPNASGKTNLVEAILVTAQGKSFRARDPELVSLGKPWYRLEVNLPNSTRVVTFKDDKKTFEIDGNKHARLPHAKRLPVVLFEPGHLLLLSGSPELRREYIDGLAEQLFVGYDAILRHYRRSLAQRNALLKKGPKLSNQLFVWDLRLSELGEQIVKTRGQLIEQLNDKLDITYSRLAQKKNQLYLEYVSKLSTKNYGSALLKKLEAERELDFLRGFTGSGPHRDDIAIKLNDQLQQQTASRGEARTILIALKSLELQLIEERLGAKPLVLLDDVFSELDGGRRKALTELLGGYQTFITTTDADMVIEHIQDANTIALGN